MRQQIVSFPFCNHSVVGFSVVLNRGKPRINRYRCCERRVKGFYFGLENIGYGAVGKSARLRLDAVKEKRAARYAKVVDGAAFVNGFGYAADRFSELSAVRDGVEMDYEIDAVVGQKVPLHGVYHVVTGDDGQIGGHFHVNRGKAAVGAVVVNDKVVGAKNIGIGEYFFLDGVDKLRVGRGAEKGIGRLLYEINSAVENEYSHGAADEAVGVYVGKAGGNSACEDAQGGEKVVQRVL